MKLAVLSDIHGNLPALEVVLEDIACWQPDHVIVNGDLINRGPYSLGGLRLVQQFFPDFTGLKGNHESYVLASAEKPHEPGEPAYEMRRFTHWTAEQMAAELDAIAAWGDSLDLTGPDGGTVHITHGSRLGNRDGISPSTDDETLAEKIGEPPQLFIGSHTHRPLVKHFNGTLVVNTGSVGTPLDDDPRAAYGRFTHHNGEWQAEITRLEFDRQRADRDFYDSGLMDQGGPIARLILEELRQSRMIVGPWMRRFHSAVLEGEIGLEQAVEEHLKTY